ncbi:MULTISPECIES: hypothetical protein [Vibrio]|uniref:hypothetical protein n=1 Tax=Vibrio TaxID=662 RepID=UPI00352D821B
MNSQNVVWLPSEYLEAVKTTLASLVIWKDENGQEQLFNVVDYAEFGRIEIQQRTIFVEVSKAKGTYTYPDGRIYEDLDVAIHAVFPNSVPFSGKQANDCSFGIRDQVVLDLGPKINRMPRWYWGLHEESVEKPENVDRMPSIFANGDNGYEGWCVTFVQKVIYGSPMEEAETRDSIYIATNDNIDNGDNYEELNANG